MSNMRDALDDLLQSLPEPRDNGFSAQVMLRILNAESRARFWENLAYGIAAVVVMASLPFTGLGELVARDTPALMNSGPLILALGIVTLTVAGARLMRE
jgi:hypothetical protein